MNRYIQIAGCGHAVPEHHVENSELEKRWGLESGWIRRRTGMQRRPWANAETATSDLAIEAGSHALEAAGIHPSKLSLVLLATSTPDHLLPPTAPLVAARLGAVNAGALDMAGACCGFLYALSLAESHAKLHAGPVLVIGANILSRRVRSDDPTTASLFSDGAGAVVLTGSDRAAGILGLDMGANGSQWDQIHIPEGGSRTPFNASTYERNGHLMNMHRGGSLFREAVNDMVLVGKQALQKARLTVADVDLWIPHQANLRLMSEARRLLEIPREKMANIIESYGNSSAATIPLALSLAWNEGRLESHRHVLMTAVGAGMLRIGLVWAL